MMSRLQRLRDMNGVPLNPHARAIVVTVCVAVLAGILLRVSGFVGGSYSWFLASGALDDSWMPMGLAYQRAIGASPGSLHDLFFLAHEKFQYPPTSLLLYSGLDAIGITPTIRALNTVIWLSILIMPVLMFIFSLEYIRREGFVNRFSDKDRYAVAVSLAAVTLFFYPIMIAWRLGQIQGLLDLLFIAACVCWVTERKVAAGVLIGLSCMVKPQLGLFLLWALLRRQYAFAAGQTATVAVGLLLSISLYGWSDHPAYLQVLAFMSQHGEVFWDNTSVNGFLNRLYHPDETLISYYHQWVPYNPVVYFGTLVSSVAIIAFAMLVMHRSAWRGSTLDFMSAAFCFTLASPIAWGHHFGTALPLFAALLIATGAEPERRRTKLFLVAAATFLVFCDDWNFTDLLGGTSFTILQSWRLFGAFAVLWLLHRMSGQTVRPMVPVRGVAFSGMERVDGTR